MRITKNLLRKYPADSAEYVVLHALWQKSRGRNPSLSFLNFTNPLLALRFAQRYAYFPVSGGSYLEEADLSTYVCDNCGISGVKLWREYNTFLDYQSFLCAKCAGEEQKKDTSNIDETGLVESSICGKTDQIGWRIPAIPTEDMETYWGYTSVPGPGVDWWKKLPNTHTLLGKPFLRAKIDYAKEYEKHLAGPNADIPFSPQKGIDQCTCSFCFYRDGQNNPKKDCQMASGKAKEYFGFSKETFLPSIIDDKDVGHYCPYWLDPCAE